MRTFIAQHYDSQIRWVSQAYDMKKCQIFITLTALALLVMNMSAQALVSTAIIPHKAAYVFETVSVAQGGNVTDVTGGMTFEWADTCEGWALDQHYLLRISDRDGSETNFSTSNVSWEAKDGLRYRFSTRRRRNGTLTEDLRGDATLEAVGSTGTVQFSRPKSHTILLPAGTKFPTKFMISQMRSAAKGARIVRDLVFEGSAVEGPQTVTTTFLPSRAPVKSELLKPPLGSSKIWPMYVAYFSADNADGRADTEFSINVQQNGIVTEFVVDYGAFKLKAKLVKIETLPETGC